MTKELEAMIKRTNENFAAVREEATLAERERWAGVLVEYTHLTTALTGLIGSNFAERFPYTDTSREATNKLWNLSPVAWHIWCMWAAITRILDGKV